MRYVKDKVVKGKREWRIVAQTNSPETFVVDETLTAYAFANERDAYDYVIGEFSKTALYKDMQPGQNYSIQMADGTTRQVQVNSQTPQAVNMMDTQTGESLMVPHVQQGAEPQAAQPSAPTATPQPSQLRGQPGAGTTQPSGTTPAAGNTPPQEEDYSVQHISPPGQNKRQYALSSHEERWDKHRLPETPPCPTCGGPGIRTGDLGNRRYYRCHSCRKAFSQLIRSAKVFTEECLNCGTHTQMLDDSGSCRRKGGRRGVEKKAIITGGPGSYHVKSEEGKNLGGPYKSREEAERRLKQVEYFKHKKPKGKKVSAREVLSFAPMPELVEYSRHTGATFNVFDEPPVFPEGKPKRALRPYRCMNCGHEKMIQTNHLGRVNDYCENCSWKPSFGNPDYAIPFGGRTYRPFEYAGPNERTVIQTTEAGRITAREVLSFAPMPELQAMPSGSVANDSQSQLRDQMNEKSPSEFSEEEETSKANPAAKRELTPHEIIDEAESLIRNSLAKGVRIGVNELQDYMQQQYDNLPDELLKGIALAWQKVEYEEAHENEAPQLGAQGPFPKSKTPSLVPSDAPIQSPKMGFKLCAADDDHDDDDAGLSNQCQAGNCQRCKSYSCECSCHEVQEYES